MFAPVYLFRCWIIIFLFAGFPRAQASEKTAVLRIGSVVHPISASLILAHHEGSLKQQGLNVELVHFETGRDALEAMLRGKVDIASCAETPLALKALEGARFSVIASIGSNASSLALLARKDRGIAATAQIRGKRLGLTRGTNGEFFFEGLRVLHRIRGDEVTIHDLGPQQLVDSLAEGSLDAIVTWDPFTIYAQEKATRELHVDDGGGFYRFSWNLAASPGTISARGPQIEALLKTLDSAGERIEKDPKALAVQLAGSLALSPEVLTGLLAECDFNPTLAQDLIVQLEGQARWFIQRDKRTEPLPNFLRYVDSKPLRQALPGHVSLVD